MYRRVRFRQKQRSAMPGNFSVLKIEIELRIKSILLLFRPTVLGQTSLGALNTSLASLPSEPVGVLEYLAIVPFRLRALSASSTVS